MFCIDNRCTDVYFNLAAEEYLLKKKKDNFFMMWQSVPSVMGHRTKRILRIERKEYQTY